VVNYPENIETCQRSRMSLILQETRKFHDLLEVNKKYPKNDEELFAYDIGHYLGLGIGQEYELLTLLSESERQEYIIQHLKNTIPTILELQKLKERIQLNGHFRKLSVEE
nr:peptidase S16 [Chitinophagaceae bacterium]